MAKNRANTFATVSPLPKGAAVVPGREGRSVRIASTDPVALRDWLNARLLEVETHLLDVSDCDGGR